MLESYKIKSYCHIEDSQLLLNGQVLYADQSKAFTEFIKAAYKSENTKYSKFFKMDSLSKLAFLAADVLLKNQNYTDEEQDIAIVFSNNSSSLNTDRKHQSTIEDKSNYFPSPAVFVYTLPNICIGEISIKYKLNSENSFFIFDRFNANHLKTYSDILLSKNKAKEVLCGWVDFEDEKDYKAFLYLVSSEGDLDNNEQEINKLYNI
ncbi:3-oxoacyl-ACP synthase [Tamlana sp. 2_MG-2023]|uniref:3-oxoacyl-ACP synthase n=1 Tax=unclassified Tamlana TaxID=2614803 RepID=UPI0026E2D098|nr:MULTISPECIES: 3-oxoacyl-ACP synthase [unclassified Tamlana]MDO6758595.1 3-oxoacyl-ACP synthase [Tamlana sp. 2_MG-2023]MDO6789294.1 3-oxoacyl-ACP synthase [Tamlana sp. 1_MG-2023]